MIPVDVKSGTYSNRIPRVGGGDPDGRKARKAPLMYSPRRRG